MNRSVVLVIAGPSGCGKSTVGRAVAGSEGAAFIDADDFHPPENVSKMARGEPLTDSDRAPWLRALRAEVHRHITSGRRLVLACSALKAAYRRLLAGDSEGDGPPGSSSAGPGGVGAPAAAASFDSARACTAGTGLQMAGSRGPTRDAHHAGSVAFALLLPPKDVLARRIAARQSSGAHFMPASLLDSQLATLEQGSPGDWLAVINDARLPGEAAATVAAAWREQASLTSRGH